MEFEYMFRAVTSHDEAFNWQTRTATGNVRQGTPGRSVYCLPMRVLVEQTRDCCAGVDA